MLPLQYLFLANTPPPHTHTLSLSLSLSLTHTNATFVACPTPINNKVSIKHINIKHMPNKYIVQYATWDCYEEKSLGMKKLAKNHLANFFLSELFLTSRKKFYRKLFLLLLNVGENFRLEFWLKTRISVNFATREDNSGFALTCCKVEGLVTEKCPGVN